MRKLLVVVGLAIIGPLVLGAESVWELAPAAIPDGFEIQGSLERDPARAHALRLATRSALQYVKAMAPFKSNLFHWEGEALNLQNRTVRIVITDRDEIIHPFARTRSDYESFVFSPIYQLEKSSPFNQDFWIVIRADKTLLTSTGELREDTFFRLVAFMSLQIYGYIHHHLQFTPEVLAKSLNKPGPIREFQHTIDVASLRALRLILDNPNVPAERPLDTLGAITRIWWELGSQTGKNNGPLAANYRFSIGPHTLKELNKESLEVIQSDFGRALFLTYALPPPVEVFNPFTGDKGNRFDDRQIFLMLLDSRDPTIHSEMLPGHIRLPGIYTPSDTLLAAFKTAQGSWWKKKQVQEYILQTVLYTDDIFYDHEKKWRKDRLARVAMALASEFYGAYPFFLSKPERIDRSLLGMGRIKARVLTAALGFYSRLKAHPIYWNWLPSDEKRHFESVAEIYREQLTLQTCGNLLLEGKFRENN